MRADVQVPQQCRARGLFGDHKRATDDIAVRPGYVRSAPRARLLILKRRQVDEIGLIDAREEAHEAGKRTGGF